MPRADENATKKRRKTTLVLWNPSSDNLILARGRSCWREASTSCKSVLSWLCAGQAARLAPTEQAGSLAVLESVLRHVKVALTAPGADAKLALHAGDEAIVLDATQSQILRATLVLLITNRLRVRESGLVVSAASPHRLGLHFILAGRCGCWREARASCKSVLSWLCAGQAARLAPTEKAGSLAVLESVLRHVKVALTAPGADAKLALHAGDEAIVLDAAQSQILRATLVLLVTNRLRVRESGLVVSAASPIDSAF